MKETLVSVVKTEKQPSGAQIEESVRRAVALAGGLKGLVKRDDLVLIKPNVLERGDPSAGLVTNPVVSRTMADLVREAGGRPVIAECAAVGCDTEAAFAAFGYDRLREQGYNVVDLKRQKTAKIDIPYGRVLKSLTTYELVAQADFVISVPVAKTHIQTEVTLGLKNMKGVETDKDKKWMHKVGIHHGVVDVNSVVKPGFALIDGILGMEGIGPSYGRPIELDFIVAGRDIVAVDSVGASAMGYRPEESLIIKNAAERGLGIMDLDKIEIAGDGLDAVRHRVIRPSEATLHEVPGLRFLYGEEACTGCRICTEYVFELLKRRGELERLEGMTVVVGNPELPEDIDERKLLTVGICVPPAKRLGTFIKGCPPESSWVLKTITGELQPE